MESYRTLAYLMRYALIVVFLLINNYTSISQEVDLSFTTTYSHLPPLESSKVRLDNKLFATIVLNDFSFKQYNVRLKLSIEGEGVLITSSNLYNYRNFTLIPGVPKVLSAFDLGDYFAPESLDFAGIDKNTFLETGTLPEGNYKLCFTVVDGESDGANELSIAECDYLSLTYKDSPVILSDLNSVLDFKRVEWSHDIGLSGEVNYTLELYRFNGNKGDEIFSYQKPEFSIKSGRKKSVDLSKQLWELTKGHLYAIFVRTENNQGFHHVFKNKGYSHPLYYEDLHRSVECDGAVVFEEIPGPGGTTLLYSYVEGCDQLLGAFDYGGFYSNTVPYVEGTGYTATIYCANPDDIPCVYTGLYGNPTCVLGNSCETEDGCPGTYGYGCECKERCTSVPIRESYNEEGQLVLTPMEENPNGPPGGLPAGCLGSENFQWTNGEISSSITVANPAAGYGFTVVCADGCTYCGVYNSRSNCWPGRACSDGDPCTGNDKLDANCNCVGQHISDCDPDDPSTGCGGTLDINVTIDPGGGSFLTADLSNISNAICGAGSIQYVWNNDYDTNLDYYYTSTGGTVTLLIACSTGCTYTAEIDLNDCIPGSPCEDDGDGSTIEYYNEYCECITFDCPDPDGDGIADDCDDNQMCEGSVTIDTDLPNQQLNVNIQDVDCEGDITYLWSSGATTASIPFFNENATYSVTVTCSTGCQYTAASEGTDEDCIVGAECENDKSCTGLGMINENCKCIPTDPDYTFDATFDINSNEITLTVALVDGVCDAPIYQWSTGETLAEITLTNLNLVYSVTVSCENSCEFVAFYSYTDGDCIIGAPCNDGIACTLNDVFDEDCNCIGTYEIGPDNEPITDDCEENPCNNYIPCDDGNPCTYFDQVPCTEDTTNGGGNDDSIPPCAGIYPNDENNMPITDCGDDPCIVGIPCNDDDPCTINDVLDADCTCIGEQLYEADGTTPQTDCDETNPCVASISIEVVPTNNYNEVLLSVVSTCDNIDSYQWSTGSGASGIVVTSQSGSYTVIVTCGTCEYTATYDTDGCLVGLPCNDGLACTENDEVQEDCACEGEPIEDLEIEFTEEDVFENSCTYSGCLPALEVISQFNITAIAVILPSGMVFQLDQGMNFQGFDFPYCYQTLSDNCVPLSDISDLADDISDWLGEGSTANIENNDQVYSSCVGDKILKINNSTIAFRSIHGYSDLGDQLSLGFDVVGCMEDTSPIGSNVTANIDCIDYDADGNIIPNEYIWSDGSNEQTVFVPFDENGDELYCLEVTVICTNGCIYTETYGINCEGCILGVFGASCDDGDPCTTGDAVNEDCECVGLSLSDSDGDGVCDDIDICPLGDDNIDLNENEIPDACDTDIDCTNELGAEIVVGVDNEACLYCLVLNDPVFSDENNAEDIYLQSVAVVKNGIPEFLDVNANPSGFSFPYMVDKASDILLPIALTDNLNAYFGNSDFTISPIIDPQCLQNDESEGPNILGSLPSPSSISQMTFVWGGNNVIQKEFYYSISEPCASIIAYTLTASLTTECTGTPSYEWNTGSTASSIQVPSILPGYVVTITCGVCEVEVSTEAVEPDCIVDKECEGLDICGNAYDGFYDAYCNCVSSSEFPEYPDTDLDGIPDCIDDCDSAYEQISNGDVICCADAPALIYKETSDRQVINYCMEFGDTDIITGLIIKGSTLTENNNYNIGGGYRDGNFFHFPYCMENNCSYYGENIDIPYTLKSYKSLAYDLQKWAVYNGYNFVPTVNYIDGGCDKCPMEGNLLYVNGMEITFNPDNSMFNEHIKIIREGIIEEKMKRCFGIVDGGYNVVFAEYETDCLVTKIEVQTKDMDTPILDESPNGLNPGGYKFGPVPHMGVGFRAIVTVQCGTEECIYEIVTPDADCIVGDPCDSPDVCATETYSSYDSEDCLCIVLTTNDADQDGVCDADDVCPGADDTIDNDNDGIPDCLDGEECGVESCTYTLDLTSVSCEEPGNGCINVSNITIGLPNGTEEAMGNLPFFSESFNIGDNCSSDQSEELVNYIKSWFSKNGYVVGEITVDNYTLTISGSNIEFLFAQNGCKDEIVFGQECIPSSTLCVADIATCPEEFICSGITLIDHITLETEDGEYIQLNANVAGFDFPYEVDYNGSGGLNITNPWNPNFIEDLIAFSDAQGLGIVVDFAEFVNGEFSIQSNANFGFTSIGCGNDIMGCRVFFACNSISNPCDDGWDCTINDHYDTDCNCVGTFEDSDNDTVCDADDQCPGKSDLVDFNSNGIPDGCEPWITVDCTSGEIPYCDYLTNILAMPDCYTGKLMQNNMIDINEDLGSKLINNPDMLVYLPFPNLKLELEGQAADPTDLEMDSDQDGIVNILDPAPNEGTFQIPFGILNPLEGIHNFGDPDKLNDAIDNCNKGSDAMYVKERALLLRTFMFTTNPGVLAGTNADDSAPLYSPCLAEMGIDYGEYNESGYVFSYDHGCYIYFELDCECNCEVVESQAINYAGDCNDPIAVGDACTTNEGDLTDADGNAVSGLYYIECPPADADPCMVYGVVSNPEYDPYNPNGAPPCLCEQQMESNGEPSEMADSDGDGICDILDECPGEPDTDSDSDGIPDCLDRCIDVVIDPEYTKDGYASPTGPGDICDDGNSCTYDDVITLDCQCQGVYIDSDDDGVYDCEECTYVEDPEGSGMYACEGCSGTVEVDAIGNVVDPDDPEGNEVAHTWTGCDVCPGIPDGDPADIGGQYEGDLPMDYNDNGLPDCIDPPYYPIGCPYTIDVIENVGIILSFAGENIDVDELPNPITISISGSIQGGYLYYNEYTILEYARETVSADGTNVLEVFYSSPGILDFDFGNSSITISYGDHQPCLFGNNTDPVAQDLCPTDIEYNNGELVVTFNYNSDDIVIDYTTIIGDYIIIYPGSENTTIEIPFGISADNKDYANANAAIFEVEIGDMELPDVYEIIIPGGQTCLFDGGALDAPCGGNENKPCDDGIDCTFNDKIVQLPDGNCVCQGIEKPNSDTDIYCDEIDPCPEFSNAEPTEDVNGDQEIDHLDINDCPCPDLELDALFEENPVLENGNDFVLYLNGDMSEYTNIVYTIENLVDPTESDDLSLSSPIIISNLEPGYEYTITITAFCGQNEAGSLSYTINVPFSDNPIICGVNLEKVELTSLTLLPSLSSGEDFQAADFTVNVKEVEGVYGKFSGTGYVSVPYFNQARLNVKFDNVSISASRQLVDGFVYVTGIGLAILGDDVSDLINGELDGIINTLDDASELIDKIISVLEEIEDYLGSVKDLVTEENLECYLAKKAILEELIAQYQEDNTSVTAEQLKTAAANLKSCFNDANDDAIAAVQELMVLIEYSFGQFNTTCPSEDDLINNLSQVGYSIDDSKAIVDDLFSDFIDLTSSDIVPLSSSSISGIEFKKGIPSTSNLAESNLIDDPLIATYYESEKDLFLCNVSKLIVEQGIFDSQNPEYDQVSAEQMLNTIIIAVTNAGANMAKEFAPELLTGIKAEDIFNKDDNAEKIKEMISDALANEVYK